MVYYSAFKKKKLLSLAQTWMNLEDVMLKAVSHTQNNKYCRISLLCGTEKCQTQSNS
jgi:hypothetical protein